MYTRVWQKFLPLIRLMLKKSITADQVVKMNRTDFDKAGGGKKAGYNFVIELKNGKASNGITSAMAKELVTVLQSDELSMATLANRSFRMEMNQKCELNIHMTADKPSVNSTEISIS